ncbi:MAG: 50S ribosomal protein L37ae [Candidatus Micrarchaeota archaeon]|nr:50S ribosomal protein L37ae [Candidatus Micrarchaeota archaeon]
MPRTKKTGSTARFGPRYGTRSKKMVARIEKLQKIRHECPQCERKTLRREAAGIWKCKKCGVKFAGGAYLPKTPTMEKAGKDVQMS